MRCVVSTKEGKEAGCTDDEFEKVVKGAEEECKNRANFSLGSICTLFWATIEEVRVYPVVISSRFYFITHAPPRPPTLLSAVF